jgi:hypothetical protein
VDELNRACNAYKILVGRCEGKRPFRRPDHRWKENVKKWILGESDGRV